MKFWSVVIGALYMLGVVASYHEFMRVNECRRKPYQETAELVSVVVSLIWPVNIIVIGAIETFGGDQITACDTGFKRPK